MTNFRFAIRLLLVVELALLSFLVFPSALASMPLAPTGVLATARTTDNYLDGSIAVTWTAVEGATHYGVKLTRKDTSEVTSKTITGQANVSTTFSSLVGGVSYTVQVRTIASGLASEWTADSLTAIPKTKPKAPLLSSVVTDIRKATVTWIAVADAENGGLPITSYLVTEINSGKSVSASATSSSIEVTALSNGATVEFTVAAVNAADPLGTASTKSDPLTLADVPATMTAPTLASTGTAGELKASWVAPTSSGGIPLVSYTVKLLKGGVDLVSQLIEKVSDLYFVFTSLVAGSFTTKVVATNDAGSGAYSVASNVIVIASASASSSPSASPTASSSATPTGTPTAVPPTPTPTPSPTATPTPSPTATPTPSNSSNDLPPAIKRIFSASPRATSSAVPSPTFSQLPVSTLSPTPVATPKLNSPSASPTSKVSATPTTSSSTKLVTVTKTPYFTTLGTMRNAVSKPITQAKTSLTLKAASALKLSWGKVTKGTKITVNVKTSTGQIYQVASLTKNTTGTYVAPALKFQKSGTYQIIMKVGKVTRVVTIKVLPTPKKK